MSSCVGPSRKRRRGGRAFEYALALRMRASLAKVPYPLLCTAIGLPLAWLPTLVHGPIAEKFNILYIQGAIAVWAWCGARMLIGFLVGIASRPRAWYLRGPLCGFLMMFPLGIVSLATPGCGFS